MIVSFADKDTEALSKGERVKRFQSFEKVARRKLRQLEIANVRDDLRVPPGNQLESLEVIAKGSTVFVSISNTVFALYGQAQAQKM